MRKYCSVFAVFFVGFLWAQQVEIKGRFINDLDEPIQGCKVQLLGADVEDITDSNGFFSLLIGGEFAEGVLFVRTKYGTEREIPITRTSTESIDLGNWIIIEAYKSEIVDDPSEWEAYLDEDRGFDRAQIGSVLQSQRDLFLNTVAFQFSPSFYRLRGLDNAHQEVRLNGLVMRSSFSGTPQWSQWGGLNDFTNRGQQFFDGPTASNRGFGGFLSTTQIDLRPSLFREGIKISQAFSNSSYRYRTMFSSVRNYQAKGWSLGLMTSRRWGARGYIEGTSYDAWSSAVLIEKIWNSKNQSWLTALYTPNKRGKSAPLTQEVFDLKGGQYNPYWGEKQGKQTNSRASQTQTPILIINHRWEKNENHFWQFNGGMILGKIATSRISYNGHEPNEGYLQGGGSNPDPVYYQNLPSYALRDEERKDFSSAYLLQQHLLKEGQLDWDSFYLANQTTTGFGIYSLYEDVQKVNQFQLGVQQNYLIRPDFRLKSEFRFLNEKTTFFAQPIDLLGASFLWDYNPYAESFSQSPNDLRDPQRKVRVGEPYQYHYTIKNQSLNINSSLNYESKGWEFFSGFDISTNMIQREGIFQNGLYPDHSQGLSPKQKFNTFSLKAGITYAITGRHHLSLKFQNQQKPPTLRNLYINPREHHFTVPNVTNEKSKQLRFSYQWHGLTTEFNFEGYYIKRKDLQEVGFYFADGVGGDSALFVQEVLQGASHRHLGIISSFSHSITPEFKIATVATLGDFRYANNPQLYLGTAPSDSSTHLAFEEGVKSFGSTQLKGYALAGGPQKAFSISLHYEDPNYWRLSVFGNYFSDTYLDVNPLLRTNNFFTDSDGLPFADYNEELASELLQQEKFPSYFILSANAGKSWKIRNAYAGFFLSVQNLANTQYKTGGFEQGRNANFRNLREDFNRELPLFGPKYWWGRGTTYFITTYYRF